MIFGPGDDAGVVTVPGRVSSLYGTVTRGSEALGAVIARAGGLLVMAGP